MITSDTTITLAAIIMLISTACTLYSTFRGKKTTDETGEERRVKEAATRAVEMTKIEVKLDTIGADVRYIKDDVATTKKDLGDLNTKVALLDAAIRSAHKRMDAAGIGRSDNLPERED